MLRNICGIVMSIATVVIISSGSDHHKLLPFIALGLGIFLLTDKG
ncbi:hypothetical protein LCGC14_0547400 [marine sediment metagenome]|uniref:Uncharacterized protein n=1 Tax=marine sediment metagenome TaxID=412755 RepID=A0A0F9S9K0_9ZZZZ